MGVIVETLGPTHASVSNGASTPKIAEQSVPMGTDKVSLGTSVSHQAKHQYTPFVSVRSAALISLGTAIMTTEHPSRS